MHEERVLCLETLAGLLSCRGDVNLGPGLNPDVARVSLLRQRLVVGDAKATETPGCTETHRRLRHYIRAAGPWIASGYAVRVAICHSPPARQWRQQLERDARVCGLEVVSSGMLPTAPFEVVSWVDLGYSTKEDPTGTIPSHGRSRCTGANGG
jgi:hypothetical protein